MEKALRFNNNKLRWRNFPLFLLKPLMEVAQYGEGKYAMYNFLKGGEQNQYLDCIKRHLEQYESPFESDTDKESGVSHLAHVAWNCLVAIYMLEHFPELDDRFKLPDSLVEPKESSPQCNESERVDELGPE
jgi:hypothetical protein